MNVKEERKRLGLYQSQVAQEVGVTTRTIMRWEQNRAKPHPKHRRKLAQLFGQTAQELDRLREAAMNKDDIFTWIIHPYETDCAVVEACLTWDAKKVEYATVHTDFISHTKTALMGSLWDKYGDEIIAHIQNKPIEDLRRIQCSSISVGETKEVIFCFINGGEAESEA